MSDPSQPRHDSHAPGSHYQPALSVMTIIVVLFVAATFLMLRSPSPTTAITPTTSSTPTSTTTPHGSAAARAKVRVQVANGTSTPNLARTYTQELMTRGWDTLPQENGQKVSATTIYFNPGFKWAALQIAVTIHVKSTAIHPLNGLNPVSGASGDDVIVILGPDLAIKG